MLSTEIKRRIYDPYDNDPNEILDIKIIIRLSANNINGGVITVSIAEENQEEQEIELEEETIEDQNQVYALIGAINQKIQEYRRMTNQEILEKLET